MVKYLAFSWNSVKKDVMPRAMAAFGGYGKLCLMTVDCKHGKIWVLSNITRELHLPQECPEVICEK